MVFDYPTPAALSRHLQDLVAAQSGEPPRAEPAPPAKQELDRLEEALAGVAAEDARRALIVTRLEGILNAFRAGRTDGTDSLEEIGTATDDEIFSMIDRELGI